MAKVFTEEQLQQMRSDELIPLVLSPSGTQAPVSPDRRLCHVGIIILGIPE